jgi:hypothetical protein
LLVQSLTRSYSLLIRRFTMEYLEVIGWVMLGFVPTLGVLEMASRRLGTRMRSRMVMGGMSKK